MPYYKQPRKSFNNCFNLIISQSILIIAFCTASLVIYQTTAPIVRVLPVDIPVMVFPIFIFLIT